MDKEYIEREPVVKKLNDIANDYIKDGTIQCSIASGTVIDIRDSVLMKAPTADVVEVEKAREEIISRMSELMSEYMKHGSGADYYAGKSESMETAIRVVREVFNNLLVSGGVGDAVELAEGENKTDFLFSRRNKNE